MKAGKLWFVICVWFLFICESCLSRYVLENNCLKVSSPENLKDTHSCVIDSCGFPQHEGSLTGLVVYPKVNQYGCNTFIYDSFKTGKPGRLPVILLADRGDCYLMLKAWNAQKAGAVAILVVDDWPEPLNNLPEVEESEDDCYMLNKTIPLALISQSVGNSMKKALDNHEFVRVNLEWTEAVTGHTEEHVDRGLKMDDDDEYNASSCYDEIEVDQQWNPVPQPYLFSRFVIKTTSMWAVQVMQNIQRWSISCF